MSTKLAAEMRRKDKLRRKMERAARPLMEFMDANFHPHTTAIVTCRGVEMVEGVMAGSNPKYAPKPVAARPEKEFAPCRAKVLCVDCEDLVECDRETSDEHLEWLKSLQGK